MKIDTFLISLGLTRSTTDANLYLGNGVLLLLYVDDFIIAYNKSGENYATEIKSKLKTQFKITDLGRAKLFLGIEIHYAKDHIALGQKYFINTVLKRFNMQNCNSVRTPLDPNVDLNNPECDDAPFDTKLYMQMVGSIMYLATGTRPDMAFCVTSLCKYNSCPLMMHGTAAARALRYLKGTTDVALHYYKRHSPMAQTLAGPPPAPWKLDSKAGPSNSHVATVLHIFRIPSLFHLPHRGQSPRQFPLHSIQLNGTTSNPATCPSTKISSPTRTAATPSSFLSCRILVLGCSTSITDSSSQPHLPPHCRHQIGSCTFYTTALQVPVSA